jgi:hypothetical protein
VEKQNHVSKLGLRLSREPTVRRFSEHLVLFDRLSPRDCKWRGTELQAPTKGGSIPWRMRLMKTLHPISHPREIRSMKQVDHQQADAWVTGRYKTQLAFWVD